MLIWRRVCSHITGIIFVFCFQSTGTEIPLDLSKNCIKRLESPLDLSRKNTVTNGREDIKPILVGPRLQYPTLSSHSCTPVPATQANRRTHVHNTLVDPVLSAFAASMSTAPSSTTLVQKVRPQTYSYAACKQADSSTKTCVIVTAHMLRHTPLPAKFYTSFCSDRVRSVLSGKRNVSVVKPTASSVGDIHRAMSFSQSVSSSCSSQTPLSSQPVHTNQMASPRLSTALFDTSRTDRGLPLAQVFPSRVVTSTAPNTTIETVPSLTHRSEELQRKSPLNSTPVLDRNCLVVCDASSLSTSKTPSSSSFASSPVLISPSICSAVSSPVSVPTTPSTSVSLSVPMLSPDVLSSCSANLLSVPQTLSPELRATRSTSVSSVPPPVVSSPLPLSDRESDSDEDGSGHELSSSLMEWDDKVSDTQDFVSDTCRMEELSVKRPAFEVIGDCNKTLLRDISQPCHMAVAFDRSLLQSECDHRDFITRTKYYRFFSRKTSGSGPHDLDVSQLEKCDSASISHSPSQEQRLSASSALKVSQTSNASSVRQDGNVRDANDLPSKHSSFSKESNYKHGLQYKKANKLQFSQLPHKGSDSDNFIGSISSRVPNGRLRSSNRDIRCNSLVLVKSGSTEESKPHVKPDISSTTFCQRRRKVIPAVFNSCSELVDSIDEVTSSASDQDRYSCESTKSRDVKNPGGSACAKHEVCDSADVCSKIVFQAHSDPTEVSKNSNKMHCKKELLTESEVVDSCGRKNPHNKVSGVIQKKPGDANNNQGKIHSLLSPICTTSVSESEHLKVNTKAVETSSVNGSQQSAKVTVNTRSSTFSRKSDTAASDSHHKMTSSIPKTRQMCSNVTLRELRHSVSDAAVLLSGKPDKTVVKQVCVTSNAPLKRFSPLRQCTRERSLARADLTSKDSKSDSSMNACNVSDAQNKMRHPILKQLESSEGYVAEKNVKYSKSEDLFDDSSLLSREQRALRVSNVSSILILFVCSKNKLYESQLTIKNISQPISTMLH